MEMRPPRNGRALDRLDRAAEPARRERAPRAPALAAEPVDLEPVAGGLEAVLAQHPLLDPLHLVAAKLDHGAAFDADQVLVHGLAREPVLVALEALPEVVLLHQLALHQQVE